jgi:bacillithiol system protein YtxJ
MKWNELDSEPILDSLLSTSDKGPVMILKHSTRCSVSFMVKRLIENNWSEDHNSIQPYLLDLIRYRGLSNRLATELGITHESPQAILIVDGKVEHYASHSAIDPARWISYL